MFVPKRIIFKHFMFIMILARVDSFSQLMMKSDCDTSFYCIAIFLDQFVMQNYFPLLGQRRHGKCMLSLATIYYIHPSYSQAFFLTGCELRVC